jgi:uncharacterized protein with PIN domain
MKYRVIATRTTYYEVEASTAREAEDLMIEGKAEEVHQATERIEAFPLCPDCDEPLTYKTTRQVEDEGGEMDDEPTYCDTCDREVDWDEAEVQS